MVKATKVGSMKILKEEYEKQINNFKEHHFNMVHQQRQYQEAVTGLKENEALIVCDFSENYEAKLSSEVQSMHASKRQITLHTGMVFWKDRAQSFCTLSDNNSHQPSAIWAHLNPIIEMIKQNTPHVTVIHFYSDGPSSQYRQKGNFYLLAHFTDVFGFIYATWSFYEAGHGKSVADGIGGCVKRTLDKKVTYNIDVTDALDAYNVLKSLSRVKFFLITSFDIEKISEIIPSKLPILKGTMKLHQISTCLNEKDKIRFRNISCFCGDLRGQCDCFGPKIHLIIHQEKKRSDEPSTSCESETKVLRHVESEILDFTKANFDLDFPIDIEVQKKLDIPIDIELRMIDEICVDQSELDQVQTVSLEEEILIFPINTCLDDRDLTHQREINEPMAKKKEQ